MFQIVSKSLRLELIVVKLWILSEDKYILQTI